MKKTILLTLLSILFVSISYAQISTIGFPFMKTYLAEDYGGEPQIWDIAQDKDGLMYFANDKRILEFDGVNWTQYLIQNRSSVRQVFIDKKNIVFAGAENEFGFLDVDEYGNKYYKSLNYLLPDSIADFGRINGIKNFENKIVFITKDYYFIYNYKTIRIIKGNYINSFSQCENNSYTHSRVYGLLKYENDTVIQISNSEIIQRYGIANMFSIDENNILIFTMLDGIYNFNPYDNSFSKKNTNIDYLLKNDYVFDVQLLDGKYYAISTYFKGIIITDLDFNLINNINEDNGLANNSCLKSIFDKDNNLWCATQNGISYIETSAPFSILDERIGVSKVITSALFNQKYMYLGSLAGFHYLDMSKNKNKFTNVGNQGLSIWGMVEYDNKIISCGSTGLLFLQDTIISNFFVGETSV